MNPSRSTSSTSSKGSTSPCYAHDKYYGQKELAEFCEFVVNELFVLGVAIPRPGIDTPPLSPNLSDGSRKEPPGLVDFIAYALYRTRLPVAITHQALYLLKRLKAKYPSARGTASSPHRLFLSSLMLSSKISMDDTYSNKSWAIVGGNFFPLREVNQMERELFAFLDFDLSCPADELVKYIKELQFAHRMNGYRTSIPLSNSDTSLASLDQRKRRRSDTLTTQESVAHEQALRHKRAADAAIALLRPSHAQQATLRRNHRRRIDFCDSSDSSSSSSSTGPSTPEYRDSSSSSLYSSAATSPERSVHGSPTTISKDNLADTCQAFKSMLAPHQKLQHPLHQCAIRAA